MVLPRRCHDLVRSFYMERLPYIDEHAITVAASRDRDMARGAANHLPRPARSHVRPDRFRPGRGTAARTIRTQRRQASATYKWVFELDAAKGNRNALGVRSATWAAFPWSARQDGIAHLSSAPADTVLWCDGRSNVL